MFEGPVESVRPKDGEHFREFALKPRGIVFEFPTLVNPSKHFSDVFSKKDYNHCYNDSTVWLDLHGLDTGFIARQFEIARTLEENEAHFTRIAEKHLIMLDPRVCITHPDEVVLAYEVSKWGPNPPKKGEPGFGQPFGPPVVDETLSQKAYTFNLNPDKTFMLSITIFPPIVRNQLYRIGALTKLGGVCPYITFEFKKSPDMLQVEAENQIAAASTLWLHKRCALRNIANKARIQHSQKQSPYRTLTSLRHYGMILFGHNWSIWITEPKVESAAGQEEKVVGYTVRELWQGRLDSKEGVCHYVIWQNWIHYWGLGPCLEAFRDDVAVLTCADDPDEDSLIQDDPVTEGMAGLAVGENAEDLPDFRATV
jgi:hypothetical protein